MTCIVGVADGKTVTIGGDSAGVGDYDLTVRADEKVFCVGEFVFGFTTSFRMGQLLRYKLRPPDFYEKQDTFSYMVTSFIENVRTVLKEGGFSKVENGVEKGGTFLVGVRGKLFCVEGDFQVGESAEPFEAVGCGNQIARGAMYALRDRDLLTAEDKVLRALSAAERFSAGVRGPFVVKTVPCNKTGN